MEDNIKMWSEEETAFLSDHKDDMPLQELSKALGRSPAVVRAKLMAMQKAEDDNDTSNQSVKLGRTTYINLTGEAFYLKRPGSCTIYISAMQLESLSNTGGKLPDPAKSTVYIVTEETIRTPEARSRRDIVAPYGKTMCSDGIPAYDRLADYKSLSKWEEPRGIIKKYI